VHVHGADETAGFADALREAGEGQDLYRWSADLHRLIEHFRERGRGVTGADIADLFHRLDLHLADVKRGHYASTFSIASTILGGWNGLVMNDFAPA
jgi:hypothetical protein